MKIRIKFRKYGVMKFIGHLDMMRYFQKAMRRAEIDICYSEGFSPHQIMSFAAPLGVGITSDGEYFDIEAGHSQSTACAIKMLNDTMVEGVEITGYVRLPDHAKPAMSVVAAADYTLSFREGVNPPALKSEFAAAINRFFTEQTEVLITKKTKRSEKTMDLKKLVYDFHMEGTETQPIFYLNLSTGSQDNLKPELAVAALFSDMGISFPSDSLMIHRLDVYAVSENGRDFVSLLDMGSVIE